LSTEAAMVPKVGEHFARKGWKVSREVRLRGRVADLVAVKDGEIAVVEVKSNVGDVNLGIEQALHNKRAANLAYLAVPNEKADQGVVTTCRNLGLGLILVDGGVREVVKPVRGEALASVRRSVLHVKPKGGGMVLRSSLERLFRSRAQILILKLLFLNPAGELHLNEIARRTDLAPSVVAKECVILLSLGVVKKNARGNQTLYQINKEGAMHDELKRIIMKYELLDVILANKLQGEKVRYALIYGSFAKGRESEKSDVDFLVVGNLNEDHLLKAMNEVERETGREVNYILWNEREFEDKVRGQIPLLGEISKTPVIMVVGEESEFKRAIKKRAD
jgi:predicted nucleotidyltransferase